MPEPIENPKSKIENLLVVGGSGYVGSLILPLIADRFRIHIFDRNPPAFLDSLRTQNSELRTYPTHQLGSVTDSEALESAAQGKDILLYMAMGRVGERNIHNATAAYDVNVKGLHLAMEAAVKAGIKRAVYTSSLSVYDGHLDIRSGATDSE